MIDAKNIDTPDEKISFEHGDVEIVHLRGMSIGRATFRPGWRWSTDVKPRAGTDSCQLHHTSYVVSGRFAVRTDDGHELELGPGDAHVVGPGHDAWVVGDQPCVTIDFIAPEPDAADEAAVREVVETYGALLRAGDVGGIVALFTPDAAVMAPDLPAAVGAAQLAATYTAALEACAMDYRFTIDAVTVDGDTAVARSHTTGATTLRGSNESTPAKYRELFVLRRTTNGWRISDYMFQPQAGA